VSANTGGVLGTLPPGGRPETARACCERQGPRQRRCAGSVRGPARPPAVT